MAEAEAVARLHHADIVGVINQGRLDLGSITRARWKDVNTSSRRALHGGGGGQTSKGSVKKQASWTHWSGV